MSDLTILLLIKDRNTFTQRWVSYYNKNNFNIPVYIADGSRDNSAINYFQNNKNFFYTYFGFDKDFNTYRKKVIQALGKIKTKYVLFASNDDLYLKQGISRALNVLKRNPLYSASRGAIRTFSVNTQTGLYGKLIVKNNLYEYSSINENTADARILEFISKSNGIWHDIIRRETILKAWENSKKYNLNNILLHDLYTYFFVCSKGRYARGKYLFMLHQDHANRLGLDETYNKSEFILSDLIRNTNMGKRFIEKICDLSNLKFKKKISFKEKFITSFYSDYINARIEKKIYGELKKNIIFKIKLNLSRQFLGLYSYYLYFKCIFDYKNSSQIRKLKLNFVDDFLRKKV